MLNKRTWKKQSRRRTKRAAIRALVGLYSRSVSEDLAGGGRQSEGFPGSCHTECVRLVSTTGVMSNRELSDKGKLMSAKRTLRKRRIMEWSVRQVDVPKAKGMTTDEMRRKTGAWIITEDGRLGHSSDKKVASRTKRRERRVATRVTATTRRVREREYLQAKAAAYAERSVNEGNFVYAEGLMGMFRLVRCMNCCDPGSSHLGMSKECNIDSIVRWRSVIQAIQPHERRRWISNTWNLGKEIPEGVEKIGERWRGQNTGGESTSQRPNQGRTRFGRQAAPGRGSGVKRYPGQKFVPK